VPAILPIGLWALSGFTSQQTFAGLAHLVLAVLIVLSPATGFLALLPLLPFNHFVVPFNDFKLLAPHGVIVGQIVLLAISISVRAAVGAISVNPVVRPAMLLAGAYLILSTFQLISATQAFGGQLTVGPLNQYAQVAGVLLVFISGLALLPGRRLGTYACFYLAAAGGVAFIGLVHFVGQGLLQRLDLVWTVHPDATPYRATGVLANPNFLGLFLAVTVSWMVVAAAWYLWRKRTLPGLGALFLLPISGLTLTLTLSRAALAALGVGLLTAVARRSLRGAVIMTGLAFIIAALSYSAFLALRLEQTYGGPIEGGLAAQAESDRLRGIMAGAAVDAFLDAPVLGHGFATFSTISPEYSGQSVLTSAHNWYLRVAAEQGLAGLGLYAALLISILWPLWRAGVGPWTASLAAFVAISVFSLTADSLGTIQAASGAWIAAAIGLTAAAERGVRSPGVASGEPALATAGPEQP